MDDRCILSVERQAQHGLHQLKKLRTESNRVRFGCAECNLDFKRPLEAYISVHSSGLV